MRFDVVFSINGEIKMPLVRTNLRFESMIIPDELNFVIPPSDKKNGRDLVFTSL